jgi:hypothetical protein
MRIIIGALSTANDKAAQDRFGRNLSRYGSDSEYCFILGSRRVVPLLENGALEVPVIEAYENLPLKTYWFVRHMVETRDFDYLFKCDHDTWIHPERLEAAARGDYAGSATATSLETFSTQHHFGKCTDRTWNQTPYQKPYRGEYFCGGYGYFLSRLAAEFVARPDLYSYFRSELYEDKAVGDLLRGDSWDWHYMTTKEMPSQEIGGLFFPETIADLDSLVSFHCTADWHYGWLCENV